MKKTINTIILLLFSNWLFAQVNIKVECLNSESTQGTQTKSTKTTMYSSKNGSFFSPIGVYRTLTIAVNIIYDQTPNANPDTSTAQPWSYTDIEGINNNPPNYLLNFFDVNNVAPYKGCVTRLYAESSFNQLILLSDYMIVNIKQSRITPNNPGKSFDTSILRDSVIQFINQNGGLNTLYGHNNLSDFDMTTTTGEGKPKPNLPDNRIDIINFLIRNSTETYGGLEAGQGTTGGVPKEPIKTNQGFYYYNTGTSQCVGSGNFTEWGKNIFTHEYAHLFLGGNEFHTSGGVTDNDGNYNTFIGGQMGYGLFDGGLTSCNGYERWRLGWYGSTNSAYPIASNNQNSDILTQFAGEKTFTLRDFVTYGDVIRIKLPYKDSQNSSNQYIWLENHQCGKNGKLDNLKYSKPNTCRDVDKAGIYAYYQVGKDILESTNDDAVYPTNEKDNLRIISAEGNYNVRYLGQFEDCFSWSGGDGRPRFKYLTPNIFNGVNNETEVIKYNLNNNSINYPSGFKFMGSKEKDGIIYDNLPWIGDGRFSAFIPTSTGKVMDISSNPSAVNTITYYNKRHIKKPPTYTPHYDIINTDRNTRKIYLTGLSIKMIDPNPNNTGMKAYTVKIRWDDYDVKQDVNWTGNIVLKEQLNLLPNKTITLEQNKTPKQINKDATSGYFDKTTLFTCENNSFFNMKTNSSVLLKEKSSLILENNSTLTIEDSSKIIVENGCTFMLKQGANLNVKNEGKVIIKNGGYICVEQGANINLEDYKSLIILEEGAMYGSNPSLSSNTNCSYSISTVGNGNVVDYNLDTNIQNEIITSNRYYGGYNIFAGKLVTPHKPEGWVIIKNNAKVILEAKENVVLDKGFEVQSGSELELKIK